MILLVDRLHAFQADRDHAQEDGEEQGHVEGLARGRVGLENDLVELQSPWGHRRGHFRGRHRVVGVVGVHDPQSGPR